MSRLVDIEPYEDCRIVLNVEDEGVRARDLPTAVVHCADCKHIMFSDMYGECSQACMGIVRPDDFCSRGERRDTD